MGGTVTNEPSRFELWNVSRSGRRLPVRDARGTHDKPRLRRAQPGLARPVRSAPFVLSRGENGEGLLPTRRKLPSSQDLHPTREHKGGEHTRTPSKGQCCLLPTDLPVTGCSRTGCDSVGRTPAIPTRREARQPRSVPARLRSTRPIVRLRSSHRSRRRRSVPGRAGSEPATARLPPSSSRRLQAQLPHRELNVLPAVLLHMRRTEQERRVIGRDDLRAAALVDAPAQAGHRRVAT